MTRLFIAIDLPGEIKDRLMPFCSGVPGVKWVKREQMHLTVRFIGETDTEALKAITGALGGIKLPGFVMRLEGLGRFPPNGRVNVLWAGVKAPSDLLVLQEEIERVLLSCDVALPQHSFSAHITLARLKAPPPLDSLQRYLAREGELRTADFRVSAFGLYASQLTPNGSVYRRLASYGLQGGR